MRLQLKFILCTIVLAGVSPLVTAIPVDAENSIETSATNSSVASEVHHGYENVRVCYYGTIQRMTFPRSDWPNIAFVPPEPIYKQWPANPQGSYIVPIKTQGIIPLLKTVTAAVSHAAANNQLDVWWRSMYEAAICVMQEHLVAMNAQLYLGEKQKDSAEPVYYLIPPTFVPISGPANLASAKNEFAQNKVKIAQKTWMSPGYEVRNRQIQAVYPDVRFV